LYVAENFITVLLISGFCSAGDIAPASVSVRDKVPKGERKEKLYENKVREYREKLRELPDLELDQ